MPWLIAFLKMKWAWSLLKQFFVFLLPHVLEWLKDKAVAYFKKAKELNEKRKQDAKAYKEYHAVVADPNTTKEEKERAAAKFLND